MNSLKPLLLAFSMALACGQLQAAAFTNGSFESGDTGNELTTVPDGWTGQVEYFSPSKYGLAAFDGTKAVDLAWYTSNPSTGNLSQSFDTVVGQTYTVNFATGNSSYGLRDLGSTIAVSAIGNYAGGSFVTPNPGTAPINWTAQSFVFTATAGSSTLTFTNTDNSYRSFAFLDAVSVTAVPEASGVTMALAALALLGGVAAKRRRG